VQDCKENQLNICLDDFGAGRPGLNQMEMSQPNSIALNAKLVRDIDTNGAKQAIIRGLMQTCDDLGIDVIAKHVETTGEYEWLVSEGIDLFQGGLFGTPQLGSMPTAIHIP
jgi:EAL domain-containing protein (putative c-di-GMP-specific phosphodiesterase class I)